MQTNYTPKMSLRNKFIVGGLVLITSLMGVLNGGCAASRLEEYKNAVETYPGKIINTYSAGGVFYFSKSSYNCRYAVKLDTMEGLSLCPGENQWKHDDLITKQANHIGIFRMLSQQNQETAAQQSQNKSQTERNKDIIDGVTERVGAGMALQGLLKAAADYAKP